MVKRFLKLIFGSNSGYCCISTKKNGKWRDKLFYYPTKIERIVEYIESHPDYDLYFSPVLYSKPRRIKNNALDTDLVWSDLDEVNPKELIKKPTIAWRSSKGRYQCLWKLKKNVKAVDASIISRRLAYESGADKSGWDITQVLRIPGTTNYKYNPPHPVKLLWDDGPSYKPGKNPIRMDQGDEPTVDILPKHKAVEIIEKLSTSLRDEILKDINEGERSDHLWHVECLLAKNTRLSPIEIVSILFYQDYNKFKKRPNQLYAEVLKALEQERGFDLTPDIVWYDNLIKREIPPPSWLIHNVIGTGDSAIIAGEPKSYKTTIAIDMAVSIASGRPFMGNFTVMQQGPVLFIQEENSIWGMRDRLAKIAMSKDLLGKSTVEKGVLRVEPEVHLDIAMINNYGFDLGSTIHQDLISEIVDRIKPRIIFFDPLYLLLGSKDENAAKDLRSVLLYLLQLKTRFNCAVAIIHHWRKKSAVSVRAGQRLLGSTTLHAWLETGIYLEVHDEAIVMSREFRNFGAFNDIEITLQLDDHYAIEILSEIEKDKLITYIAEKGEVNIVDISEYFGITRRKARRWLSKVEDIVTRTKDGFTIT